MNKLILTLAALLVASPAFAQRIITKGATDETVEVLIIDSADGTPETGVLYNTSGIDLWYQRPGAAKTSITEATLAALTTAHTDGGFLEIANGMYRLDLPDAAFATGVSHVTIGGTVTGMIVRPVTVQLVDPSPVVITPFFGGDIQEDSGDYEWEFSVTVNGVPTALASGAVQVSVNSGADAATGLTLNTVATGRYEVVLDSENAVFNGVTGDMNFSLSAGTVGGLAMTNAKIGEASMGRFANAPTNFESLSVDGSGAVIIQDGTGAGQIATTSGAIDTVTTVTQLTAATTEPTSVPSATAGFIDKVNWLFLIARNKKNVTDAIIQYFADDGSTVVGEKDLSDNGTTYTETEAAAP